MASIRLSIPLTQPPAAAWAAVADVGAVHERLARGFVVDTRLEGDRRTVTFDNGFTATELLVDVDDAARRIAYAEIDSPLPMRHHHATMEIVDDGGDRARLLWVADVAPDDVAQSVNELMRLGANAIRQTLGDLPPDRGR